MHPTKTYYCTYFNAYYLPRFFALKESMKRYCGDFILYCVCMDDTSYEEVKKIASSQFVPILWKEFEDNDIALQEAKHNRSTLEYFFTCTPSICYYVIRFIPEGGLLQYIDADIYFYNNPEPIFDEMIGKSIGIIEHRFWGLGIYYKKYGRFNVGWLSFRHDKIGLQCLSKWRQQCLEWCYDKLEEGKFADQKYLDKWPKEYGNALKVIVHKGANVAPWNVGRYKLSVREGILYVDIHPIIFFHFASLKRLMDGSYISRCGTYHTQMRGILLKNIYQPYVDHIASITHRQQKQLHRDTHTLSWKSSLKSLFLNLRTWIFSDRIRRSTDL